MAQQVTDVDQVDSCLEQVHRSGPSEDVRGDVHAGRIVIVGYLVSLSILPFVNLWEETAWTDVIQHNLARRRGPLLAAMITGPLFGLVHLPLRLSNRVTMDMLTGLFFAMILAIGFRFLIGWLYYSSGRSILIAAITHATFNATNNGDLLLHAQPDSVVLQKSRLLRRGSDRDRGSHRDPRPARKADGRRRPRLRSGSSPDRHGPARSGDSRLFAIEGVELGASLAG